MKIVIKNFWGLNGKLRGSKEWKQNKIQTKKTRSKSTFKKNYTKKNYKAKHNLRQKYERDKTEKRKKLVLKRWQWEGVWKRISYADSSSKEKDDLDDLWYCFVSQLDEIMTMFRFPQCSGICLGLIKNIFWGYLSDLK